MKEVERKFYKHLWQKQKLTDYYYGTREKKTVSYKASSRYVSLNLIVVKLSTNGRYYLVVDGKLYIHICIFTWKDEKWKRIFLKNHTIFIQMKITQELLS